MSIIFVGSTVDRETLKKLPDSSVAGNKMELGFVKGFLSNGIKTLAISVEAHGMWHFNDKPIVVSGKKLHDDSAEIHTVPYLNIPIIKQLMIIRNIKKALNSILKDENYKDSTLIVYNTMTIFASPVLKVAHKNHLKCIAIIADLPINFKKNIIRKIEDRKQIAAISKFDGLIPLTKYISEDFAPKLPFFVIEAGCNPDDYESQKSCVRLQERKVVVFSGTLNVLSGIESLIEAMKLVKDPKIELDIYGDGPLKDKVLDMISSLNNVHYRGCVSNEEMMSIQKRSNLLVCPRKADSFTTKYTFPSKVLEYICSGVPVLSNRLPGIPSEYEKYINYTSTERTEDWSNSINTILSEGQYTYFIEKAIVARDTVLATKNWENQVSKLINQLGKQGILIE